ncbi:MAG: outer membrane protein assembly factor BamB [Gammaproteobacteria bacterium]|nr:outer membrane protein assembly factor BamB [Gammaproteobacteria bacterium]
MRKKLIVPVLVTLFVLQACIGGGKRKDVEQEPVELTKIENGVQMNKIWSARLGGGAKNLRLGLRPASDGTRIFAASHSGDVAGFDLVSGNRDWAVKTDIPLTGGPGYGDGLVVVGSEDGDVVAIDAVTGAQRWSQQVAGEILAVPVIYSGVVIIRTVNGRVYALEALNGSQRWVVEQPVPRLSLRGISQPAVARDRVVVGFDNGRVAALSLRNGADLWQAPLSTGRGRTELERLSDIDSNVIITGEEVYVAGYQSRAALVFLGDGRAAWAEDLSSAGGLAVGGSFLFSTGGDGQVIALSRENGAQQWQQDGLMRRGVTGPVFFANTVVVGDFEGYLHLLSPTSGSLIGRARAGSAAIVSPPLAVGERLFVQDEAGTLVAFRSPQVARP